MMKFKFRHVSGDPDGHNYVFEVHVDDMPEDDRLVVYQWCVAAFGKEPKAVGGSRWHSNFPSSRFWFRDEIDAFEFRVRWC